MGTSGEVLRFHLTSVWAMSGPNKQGKKQGSWIIIPGEGRIRDRIRRDQGQREMRDIIVI